MSELQEKYDKAVSRRQSIFSKSRNGMTEAVQSQLDAATDEVIKLRNKLIETGQWEGPIPIPVKKKYR